MATGLCAKQTVGVILVHRVGDTKCSVSASRVRRNYPLPASPAPPVSSIEAKTHSTRSIVLFPLQQLIPNFWQDNRRREEGWEWDFHYLYDNDMVKEPRVALLVRPSFIWLQTIIQLPTLQENKNEHRKQKEKSSLTCHSSNDNAISPENPDISARSAQVVQERGMLAVPPARWRVHHERGDVVNKVQECNEGVLESQEVVFDKFAIVEKRYEREDSKDGIHYLLGIPGSEVDGTTRMPAELEQDAKSQMTSRRATTYVPKLVGLIRVAFFSTTQPGMSGSPG
ncbi:hypothetical protein BC938DRAFT_478051 [Jimgerdemannia flammicorona]|uniref:Uncharacterized protein n=1 Tax=Jimgerdemannia flammicorona TaxID=994334 RepID=A0A433QNH5_9FUNG|nr:hypothetical protein BC938DRAFT_478051 [Jimgerdemannia flammicorona]